MLKLISENKVSKAIEEILIDSSAEPNVLIHEWLKISQSTQK